MKNTTHAYCLLECPLTKRYIRPLIIHILLYLELLCRDVWLGAFKYRPHMSKYGHSEMTGP